MGKILTSEEGEGDRDKAKSNKETVKVNKAPIE